MFNIVLKVLSQTIRQEKEIKDFQIGKEEVKLSLFADDVILYVEYSKDSPKKAIELAIEFRKFTQYRLIYKNQLYFWRVAMKIQK